MTDDHAYAEADLLCQSRETALYTNEACSAMLSSDTVLTKFWLSML